MKLIMHEIGCRRNYKRCCVCEEMVEIETAEEHETGCKEGMKGNKIDKQKEEKNEKRGREEEIEKNDNKSYLNRGTSMIPIFKGNEKVDKQKEIDKEKEKNKEKISDNIEKNNEKGKEIKDIKLEKEVIEIKEVKQDIKLIKDNKNINGVKESTNIKDPLIKDLKYTIINNDIVDNKNLNNISTTTTKEIKHVNQIKSTIPSVNVKDKDQLNNKTNTLNNTAYKESSTKKLAKPYQQQITVNTNIKPNSLNTNTNKINSITSTVTNTTSSTPITTTKKTVNNSTSSTPTGRINNNNNKTNTSYLKPNHNNIQQNQILQSQNLPAKKTLKDSLSKNQNPISNNNINNSISNIVPITNNNINNKNNNNQPDSDINAFIQCQWCELCFTVKSDVSEHELICGSRTIPCEICKKLILIKTFHSHRKDCQKQMNTLKQKQIESSQFTVTKKTVINRNPEDLYYKKTYDKDHHYIVDNKISVKDDPVVFQSLNTKQAVNDDDLLRRLQMQYDEIYAQEVSQDHQHYNNQKGLVKTKDLLGKLSYENKIEMEARKKKEAALISEIEAENKRQREKIEKQERELLMKLELENKRVIERQEKRTKELLNSYKNKYLSEDELLARKMQEELDEELAREFEFS